MPKTDQQKLESDIKLLRQVVSDNLDRALRFINDATFTLRRIQSDLMRLRDFNRCIHKIWAVTLRQNMTLGC